MKTWRIGKLICLISLSLVNLTAFAQINVLSIEQSYSGAKQHSSPDIFRSQAKASTSRISKSNALPKKISKNQKPVTTTGEIRPFLAKYTAFRSGNDVGEAKLELSQTPVSNKSSLSQDSSSPNFNTSQYELTYQSKVSRFFLSDKRFEKTIFSVTELGLMPHNYEYKRTGTGPNKSLKVKFDENNGKIHINDDTVMDWQGEFDNQLFRIDLPQKLAKGEVQFSYDFINYRGDKRNYQLSVISTDNLSLPYGAISAVKVKIDRGSSSRVTYAWFAPALSFNLVRLQQFKDKKEQGDIQLSSFSYL